MRDVIERTLRAVRPPRPEGAESRTFTDGLPIPPLGLGFVAELGRRLADVYRSRGEGPAADAKACGASCPVTVPLRKLLLIAAADHGVSAHGVTRYPQKTTAELVRDVLAGRAVVARLAPSREVKAVILDAGVRGLDGPVQCDWAYFERLAWGVPGGPGAGRGSADVTERPAMSRDDALASIAAGIEACERAASGWDVDLLGLGDLGLGSTISACAVAATVTQRPLEALVGKDASAGRRAALVRKALDRATPDPEDPVGVLAEFGGVETGVLAGACLAAAAMRVPVLLDGVVSAAAAVIARGLSPAAADYLIASHEGAMPAHGALLERLGLRPLLRLDLNLGEGAGAVLAMSLVESAWELVGMGPDPRVPLPAGLP